MKKIFRKIIVVLLISMFGFLTITNINHMYYLSKQKYTIDYEAQSIINTKKSLSELNSCYAKLASSNLKYTKDEKNTINKNFAEIMNILTNYKFLREDLKGEEELNAVAYAELINGSSTTLYTLGIYHTIENYSPELVSETFVPQIASALFSISGNQKLWLNYQYTSSGYYDDYNMDVAIFLNALLLETNTARDLCYYILEEGVINE